MRQLEKRGRELARAREMRALERLVEVLMRDSPGARVEADQRAVRVSGAGLVRRWLTDSSLRFVGGMMK